MNKILIVLFCFITSIGFAQIPADPPAPTLISNDCGDAVLKRANPPVNVTYYWQGDSCDQTQEFGSDQYISFSGSNTYYLRAYGTSGSYSVSCSWIEVNVTNATMCIQPDASGKDTYTSDWNPSTNYGNSASLVAGYDSEYGVNLYTYIQFDLSSIPANAVITDAYIKLYAYGSYGGGVMKTKRVTAEWDETTITWNNQPSSTTEIDSESQSGIGQKAYDITTALQNWLSGSWGNYGVSITTTGDGLIYYSSDTNLEYLRPKLVINYTLPNTKMNAIGSGNMIINFNK